MTKGDGENKEPAPNDKVIDASALLHSCFNMHMNHLGELVKLSRSGVGPQTSYC